MSNGLLYEGLRLSRSKAQFESTLRGSRKDAVTEQDSRGGSRTLLFLTIVYGAASLLHFAHNAIFLRQYPNLPVWLTAGGVWAAWCGITAVGTLGYIVYRRVSRATGLIILAVYALLGFGGLDHYAVAPVSAHSIAMSTTIIVEVAAASALLIGVAYSVLHLRPVAGRAWNRP
jgi:hypothetical protein